jgi:hypothetical protein
MDAAPDTPQAIASEIDALEFVVEEGRIANIEDYGILRSWLCRLRPAWESTPSEPSKPGEGTTLTPLALTEPEHSAVWLAANRAEKMQLHEDAAVLRGLLERTQKVTP